MNVSVIGLGKLGLCTAACFASSGHQVTGYDTNAHILSELTARRCPIDETNLSARLENSWNNFMLAADYEEAVMNSEITFIIVPTPSLPDGKFTNSFVESVIRSLAPALKKKREFHVVNVVSTVMPGSSEKLFKPLLEDLTGKKCGVDFGLVYNPEFIALGSVIRNFLNPDIVLIGTSDERSGRLVGKIYEETCKGRPTFAIMSLINAEIAKLSLNCYVTMKISFANSLASICEKIPGADVDVITDAIGADARIGSRNLKGGLGFGGPCFPRDNIAFQVFTRDVGIEMILSKAVVDINDQITCRLFERISGFAPPGGKIALFGLSYKTDTHIVEESQSIHLARRLVDAGFRVAAHDPRALRSAHEVLGGSVHYHEDPYVCADGAHAIALLTDWPIYKQLDWERIAGLVNGDALLIDSWRAVKGIVGNKFVYLGLGIGPLC